MKCCGWQVVLILALGVLAGVIHMQFADAQVSKIVERLNMPKADITKESPTTTGDGLNQPANGNNGTGSENSGGEGTGPENGSAGDHTGNGAETGNGETEATVPAPISFYDWSEQATADMVRQAADVGELEGELAIIIDARPSDLYVESHIQGAYSLTRANFRTNDFPAGFDEWLEFQQPILIYCDGGDCQDSEDLKFELMRLGFERIFIITDGYPGLVDAGFPVVTGETPEGDGGGG